MEKLREGQQTSHPKLNPEFHDFYDVSNSAKI